MGGNLPDQVIEPTMENEYEEENLPELNLEFLRDDVSLLCSHCKKGWLFGNWMTPNWSPEPCLNCQNRNCHFLDAADVASFVARNAYSCVVFVSLIFCVSVRART